VSLAPFFVQAAPGYRSQSVLAGAVRSMRRAVRHLEAGDLSEAVRHMGFAEYIRGVVAIEHERRPSTKRVDAIAGKVALAIGREIDRRCGWRS